MAGSALLVCLLLLGACGGEEIAPPRTSDDTSARHDAGATEALRALQRGLDDRDRPAVLRLAAPDPASRSAVAAIFDNARALDLSELGFSFVADGAGDPPARLDRYGLGAWTGTVDVSWRITGYDEAASSEETRFSFVQVGSGTRIAAAGGGQDRVPLWLAEPLTVRSRGDSLVMVSPKAGITATRVAALAARAVLDVRRVLTSWRGRLVVEVPASERALESVLGADPGHYRAIAGVTTTVDGRQAATSPVHVFLNPEVYDGLGPEGSQVVLSHETTHVATRAPFASMPTWLLEGFADYVALAHADVPLATAAGQIFARVRRDGPPDALPSASDLSPSAAGLGATYEEAWTVCRYIAQTYGEQRLIRLYDRVDAGTSTDRAFETVLGVSRATVVDGWRTNLRTLAHDVASPGAGSRPGSRSAPG